MPICEYESINSSEISYTASNNSVNILDSQERMSFNEVTFDHDPESPDNR